MKRPQRLGTSGPVTAGEGPIAVVFHSLSAQGTHAAQAGGRVQLSQEGGFAGGQTLFAPAFVATDEELAEMVARFADAARQVANAVEKELGAFAGVGAGSESAAQ
jgi:hypothetical protein